MKSQELLALLTARVQRFQLAPGGIPDITQEDIAHAMGRIESKSGSVLIRVKYCGRAEDLHSLDLIIWTTILEMYPQWTGEPGYVKGGEFVRKLCQMALAEHMDDHRCPVCKGTSSKIKEDLKNVFHQDQVYCETCGDSGKVYPTEEFRASMIGLNMRFWDRVWGEKYRKIQQFLHNLESDAVGDMTAALKEVETA